MRPFFAVTTPSPLAPVCEALDLPCGGHHRADADAAAAALVVQALAGVETLEGLAASLMVRLVGSHRLTGQVAS